MTPEHTMLPYEDDDGGGPLPDGNASFEALDPGWTDPGYWNRFQHRTLALVEPELARRRRALERVTVSGVVTSWSRTVVPVAMVAAAAAVMVLLTEPADSARGAAEPAMAEASAESVEPVRDEETSGPALDGGPILTLEEPSPAEMSVMLTAAVEGF